MPSAVGVKWVREAERMLKVLELTAPLFVEALLDATDYVAKQPEERSSEATYPFVGQGREYAFYWDAIAVTIVFRIDRPANVMRVKFVTAVPRISGINPFP